MFHRLRRFLIAALVVLVVSACGQSAATGGTQGTSRTAIATMDQGGMPMASATAMMGQGEMQHGGMQHGGTQTSSAPFDAQFIDSMTEHHQGAISMARQALNESQRMEIKQLAQNIISSQQQEVDQMTTWRKQWYPDVPSTGGMGMEMGDMDVSADTSRPFDQRFISAMIAHHEGAIAMANEAQTKAEHAEIKDLAAAIIKAQEAEVAQLKAWNSQWFGG